jgi:hypothetical protein
MTASGTLPGHGVADGAAAAGVAEAEGAVAPEEGAGVAAPPEEDVDGEQAAIRAATPRAAIRRRRAWRRPAGGLTRTPSGRIAVPTA